jgi:hypothetical protein
VISDCFPALTEILPPQKQMVPKSKVKVLNGSDNVRILNLLKGSLSLLEIGQLYGKHDQAFPAQH